ncbi:hypothetical protein PIROE2DRAFT_17590 [Piromyces sp. E2]|nr:hypothetical protein PIROE2DRAFT_17590 [Piromyces sp. E2]|eukprot:OUM57438.1 hypothetical protein PIROE2DRAFT_17590 [Piromyces sp. E2]
MKLINFTESPVICELENVNIQCYQSNTCSNNSTNFTKYKECTKEEIVEIQKSLPLIKKSNDRKYLLLGLFILSIFITVLYLVLIKNLQKKHKNQRRNNNNNNTNRNNHNLHHRHNHNYFGRSTINDDDILPSYQDAIKVSPQNNPNTNFNTNSTSPITNINDRGESRLPTYEEIVNITGNN